MWCYEKRLQYPVNIKNSNPKLAKIILSQYGGPDGELASAVRYLSQRFTMPYPELKAVLTDIGTEELNHLEIIGTIIYQLTKNISKEEIENNNFQDYFVNHTTGISPENLNISIKSEPIADLHENLSTEQKSRVTYENILRFCDDPAVKDPIKFLREREIVHYQRFGETLRMCTDKLNSKNFYEFNSSFKNH
ncbi:MAG: manganese catalase family protein [Candidatus Paraimprobicoccus trichonymphae]|uniref:Manganese catalase family protein n=1 Tax=Candidatus Paraimprobicoccus trichonymphae TaxID=3033793 RepID=A0AA48KZH6_9FIRM|nr:MAG: manganese catalase family protein [Candidatus Paraimprobicoccus trichonymphae]